MSAKEINNTLDFLKKKLSEIYSVDPKPKAKADALKALDDFKEKSPNAAACGLKLVEKTQTSYFRFYGLQLLQHVVKTRWTDMSPNEQKLLKINVMSLISNGTKHITLEKSDIKDGFARIVVEIIKLDWPNEWPNLLTDLDAISKKQEINAEIVLLILWRLAEDVVTLQIDPVPRAAELKRSLVENMKDILSIILGLLEKNVVRFRVMKTDRSQQFVVQPCCTVAITAIYTLSAYISWMGIWHITQDDCKLLETLWVLLDEPDLQLAAAECLLVAIQRMEKLKNNSVISALFGDSSMSYILSASKMSTGEELTEKNKNALKKICQVVCSLGTVLCNITDSGTPSSFGRYLISLLEFTERSTPFLHFPTQNTWTAILKHEVFSRDPKLLAILPNYLSAIMTNLEKIGFNQKNPSEKSAVLGLFTDKDFSANYQNIHEEQREIIKLACKVEPLTCFKMASLCLKYQLYPAAGAAKGEKLKFLNSASSTSLEQWQSKAFFIEIVMSEVFKLLRKEAVPVKETIELIKIAVHFEPKHPSILPYVNTAVASLLNVFNAENEPSIEFLIQMFEMIEFIKTPTLQSVKDVKSNAFACIIKMWQEKANIFLPHFPTLFNHVKHLLSDELLLTAAEKSFLTKGLIQLSNHFVNYQLQRTFLEELLAPVAALWLSEVMHGLLSDPETFIAYIGADPAVVAKNSENPTALYRSRISYCVSSILEVLRCTQRPASQMEAVAGRFLTGYMPNGEHIYRNPCMDLVLALLNNVFILIRTLHILHLPEVINSVGGMFEDVLKRLEVDKIPDPDPQKSLMEIYNAPVYKTEVEKIQAFFCTLYIESFSILGHAAQSFKENFYQVDDLVNQLLNSALINLEHLPTHRLHTMLTNFVKPLVVSCPPQHYQTFLCPILAPYMAAIHVRLGKEWQIIGQRMNGKQDERPVSLDNVDEEQVRLLTQEIIRFIDSCCVTNKDGDPNVMAAKSLDDDDDDGGDDDNVGKDTQSPQASSLGLTELGKCLMKETDIRASLLITAFSSLEWNDSLTCYRSATHVCWPLLNHVVSEPLLPDAVAYFFTMVLKGLKQHTGHSVYIDALVQLGFQIYEALRPRYTKLKDVLQQLPEIRDYFLLTYDKKVLCTPISAQDYVLRKYCFARLIQGYVGRSLTEVPIEETKAGNQPPASKKLKSLVPPTMEQKSPSGNQEHLTSPNSYEAPFGHPEHIRPLMLETSLRRPGPQMAHFNEMARFRLPAQNAGHFMPGGRGTMLIRSFLGTPPFFPPRFR